jgi:galactokinase
MKTFAEVFGGSPTASADAPGRVNLLGEHTDYSEGFVLPTVIPQRTRITLRASMGRRTAVYSANLDERDTFVLGAPPGKAFARYLYGCAMALHEANVDVPPLDVHVASEVPIGVGLSSSAALEVAMLRALRALLGVDVDDVRIAQLAHRAENEYTGVRCGILDQMACSLLGSGGMLFLDTRSLARRLLPLPANAEILVIDSGIARTLATTKYNERRAECEEAARRLGLRALRDATDVRVVDTLPEPLRRRARHVITENRRALRAADGVDAGTFGALMSESHASLRDDYEVSIEALDDLVGRLLIDIDCYGAKLTGAGFGGACVALCRTGASQSVARRAVDCYNTSRRTARVLVPPL